MAPSPWTWPAAWVELAAAVVLAAAYALAARRYRPDGRRVACFAGALALFLAVTVTPLGTLALHYVLWAHLVQNVALAEWIPLLVVASLPPALAASAARFHLLRLLARPFVALPLWLAGYMVWHIPALYDAALEHHALLQLEHLTSSSPACCSGGRCCRPSRGTSRRARSPRTCSRPSSSPARSASSWLCCRARSTTSTWRPPAFGG